MIGQLRALNEAYALLGVLVFCPAASTRCRRTWSCAALVGQLAIFSRERRPPELPRLQPRRPRRLLLPRQATTRRPPRSRAASRSTRCGPSRAPGCASRCRSKPAWLESSWQMFVGVKSTLPIEECVNLLTMSGQLGMKIGSSDRVDAIHRHGTGRPALHAHPAAAVGAAGRPGADLLPGQPRLSAGRMEERAEIVDPGHPAE